MEIDEYLSAIRMIERLHRQFLEMVRKILDAEGVRDLNAAQAVVLYHIGEDDVTVGELTNRGYYLGSNPSYNVRKMVEADYLIQNVPPMISDPLVCVYQRRGCRFGASCRTCSIGRPWRWGRIPYRRTTCVPRTKFWLGLNGFGAAARASAAAGFSSVF